MSRFVLTRWLSPFWRDERGFVLSAELVIISTILVIGLVTGLNCLRTSVTGELEDVGSAIGSLNQSYWYRGYSGRSHGPCGVKSQTVGSIFVDRVDGGIDAPSDVSGDVDALFQRQLVAPESGGVRRRIVVPADPNIVPIPEGEAPRIIVPAEPFDPSAVPSVVPNPCPPGTVPRSINGATSGQPCDCVPSSGATTPRSHGRIVPSPNHQVVPHDAIPHDSVPFEAAPRVIVPHIAPPTNVAPPQPAAPTTSREPGEVLQPHRPLAVPPAPASDNEKRPPRKSNPPAQPE